MKKPHEESSLCWSTSIATGSWWYNLQSGSFSSQRALRSTLIDWDLFRLPPLLHDRVEKLPILALPPMVACWDPSEIENNIIDAASSSSWLLLISPEFGDKVDDDTDRFMVRLIGIWLSDTQCADKAFYFLFVGFLRHSYTRSRLVIEDPSKPGTRKPQSVNNQHSEDFCGLEVFLT